MFGFITIREGERVAVWKQNGTRKVLDGPKLLFKGFNQTKPMNLITAEPDEYLQIKYLTGETVHKRGPVSEWYDELVHQEINVEKALPINANEAIVIYKEENGQVNRRIQKGPALAVIEANEWLHHFRWHGADPENHRLKIPGALEFSKLRVIPDQLYFDVDEVRTTDEALLTIKLMVFYELTDIEKMLDKTHDPIADFINALAADIIGFVGCTTFEKFKERTRKLNELDTYKQLAKRAECIGYKISKVVYRGYHANTKLQAMHDNAIETRTALLLEAETEKQAQELKDLKQDREVKREQVNRDEAVKAAKHERELDRLLHEEKMKEQLEQQEATLEFTRKNNELAEVNQEKLNKQRIAVMTKIKELGADLTQVLVAENRNPDTLIKVDGENKPQLHLHETG